MSRRFDSATARLVHGQLARTQFLSPVAAHDGRGADDAIATAPEPGAGTPPADRRWLGVPAAAGAATPLQLLATVGHAISGDDAWLHVDRLHNPLSGGHSGSIRLRLIATSQPIGPLPFDYLDLAHLALDVLAGGESHDQVDRIVRFAVPSSGTYHLALGVFEFDSRHALAGSRSEWLVDHCPFAGRLTVAAGRIVGCAARTAVRLAVPRVVSAGRRWFALRKPDASPLG